MTIANRVFSSHDLVERIFLFLPPRELLANHSTINQVSHEVIQQFLVDVKKDYSPIYSRRQIYSIIRQTMQNFDSGDVLRIRIYPLTFSSCRIPKDELFWGATFQFQIDNYSTAPRQIDLDLRLNSFAFSTPEKSEKVASQSERLHYSHSAEIVCPALNELHTDFHEIWAYTEIQWNYMIGEIRHRARPQTFRDAGLPY